MHPLSTTTTSPAMAADRSVSSASSTHKPTEDASLRHGRTTDTLRTSLVLDLALCVASFVALDDAALAGVVLGCMVPRPFMRLRTIRDDERTFQSA